ncbi:MAG: helix-turn-helix transcriptional regulator, partial [bacterium]
LLSGHGLALIAIARRPGIRIREVARELGITERSAQDLVSDLATTGYIERIREGRRNRYVVLGDRHLQHPLVRDRFVSDLTRGLGARTDGAGVCEAVVLACSDFRIQPDIDELLVQQGLIDRAEILLWPGGGAALAGPDRNHLYGVLMEIIERRSLQRVVLIAHAGCDIPDTPTAVGSTPADSYRATRKWARRLASACATRLGFEPELWFTQAGRFSRVSVTPIPRRPADGRTKVATR